MVEQSPVYIYSVASQVLYKHIHVHDLSATFVIGSVRERWETIVKRQPAAVTVDATIQDLLIYE